MSLVRVAPLLSLVLFACAPKPAPERASAAPPSEVIQPVRVPATAPVPSPRPTPARAARPAVFSFSGELEQGGWLRGQVPGGTVSARLGETPLTLGEEGRFFAAFDRDSPASMTLTATLDDGRVIDSPLTIAPRNWDIERVNVARRAGGPSESFMRRRQPELDAIWDARLKETDAQGWRQDFMWPVTGRISGRFGSQRIYRGEPGSYHSGIDVATGASGTPYVAPADGVVVLAETDFSLEGQLLIIDHGQGLNSAFLHSSRLYVTVGDKVRQGQHIGDIGSSGRATGPHLHWSLKWRNARLDPLLFTGPMR